MSKRWFTFISLVSLSGSLFCTARGAIAAPMPLTQATLRKVVNDVKLFLDQQPPRNAQINDRLGNGDALKTAQASRAELKFNDGTLAKVGEYATFRFTPNTRRFDLKNGNYLFLVPPGRGNTEFYTPNARAGVRGSALFLSYDAATDTTTMGALTNNPLGPMDITVGNQKQDLYAGQMAIVIKNRIDRVETFDLRTFYNTSALFKGVDLSDPEVQAVRLEISEALQLQSVLQNGSALSQTPPNLNSPTAIPSVIAPTVMPAQIIIDPSIAQLREPRVVKPSSVPPVVNPIPTPLLTGNPVNPIENLIPIVPRSIKEIPAVKPSKSTSDPLKTTFAEPTPVKAEPEPIKVEPAPIRVQPKPIQVEPIAIKVEPKPVEPSVNPTEHHHYQNPTKIVIPKIDVTFSTPKTEVQIETPRIEIIIQPTKINGGNSGIPTLEIPKFDTPKITETPKIYSPRVNTRPEITLDVPIKVMPLQTPVNPISTPQPEAIRTAPDIAIPTPQTIVTPIMIPVAIPVASPIVQPFTQPTVLQDTPIMKPTIVEPILTFVVIPVMPMTPVKVIPVAPITPIVSPTVVTPTPMVVPPTPTVATPTPAVVPPTPTVVTPTPMVVPPTPTVVPPTPTVVTPTPTVVTPTPIPTVITPTPVVVPVRPTP